jgi:hypothetical protein
MDSYRNLTYKTVMALKWFSYFCSEVNFLLKVDDDLFINMPNIYKLIETFTSSSNMLRPSQVLFGRKAEDLAPIRDTSFKWHLSKEEYPEEYFPQFCMGYFVLYSSDVVVELYNVSQHLPFLWIEDIQVTGIARSKTNITISTNTSLILDRQQTDDILNGSWSEINRDFVVAAEDMNESDIRQLWEIIANEREKFQSL